MNIPSQKNSENNQVKIKDEDINYFIEPIKQKLFNFELQQKSGNALNKIKQLRQYKAKDAFWKPTLNIKKIMDDPKFILSMERKKARIISAIRDRQNDQRYYEKTVGSMIGSKLKHQEVQEFKKHSVSKAKTEAQNMINNQNTHRTSFVTHEKMDEISLKKKKNPYMSFSLSFIKDGKKKRNERIKSVNTNSGKNNTTTFREKGSNEVYQYQNLFNTENLVLNNSLSLQKNKQRPLTTKPYYHRSFINSSRSQIRHRPQSVAPF